MRPSGKMPGCAPTREVRPFDCRGRRALIWHLPLMVSHPEERVHR